MQTNKTIKQAGFTLIELLVVAPLVILLIGVMIGYISAVTGDGLKSQQQNSLAYETQAALDDIDTTSAKALSFKSSTPSNTPAPQGPSDGAGSFASSANVLVLESIALTANSSNDSRTPVYSEGNATSCDTASAPYTYYTAYFLSNGSLYKRIILPKTPVCPAATPQQKNSCSAIIMQGSSKGNCQVEDEKLADNITTFDISYLNDAGNITTFASSTTINIKINAQKSVAGSVLTYAGSFRSKKQNSFLASTQAPAVTGNNLADVDKFICNWDQAANATSYTVSVRFGTDAPIVYPPESPNTFTKTIDIAAKRGQRFECQVTANLSSGTTLAYTPQVLDPIPLWTDPTLENNWVRYDPTVYAGAGFTKTASGMIVLKGLIKSGTAPGRAFQLPEGYRPQNNLLFQQSGAVPNGGSAAARVDVNTDGSVFVQGSANAWISLAGINFMPSQYQSAFDANRPITFANGWIDYHPTWQRAGYMQDSAGRLRVQGLISTGTTTDNTLTFNIPSNLRPAEYEHVAAHNSGSFGVIGNSPANGILAKGGGNGYLETNTLTYPSSYTGWTNLTLGNGWVRYPGYTTPKFTKGSDGLVMLKGLIQSGGLGYVFNIPGNQKLCPKERHIYAVASAGAYGRLDVEPGTATGGCGVSLQAGSSVWASLDSVSWIGEI